MCKKDSGNSTEDLTRSQNLEAFFIIIFFFFSSMICPTSFDERVKDSFFFFFFFCKPKTEGSNQYRLGLDSFAWFLRKRSEASLRLLVSMLR